MVGVILRQFIRFFCLVLLSCLVTGCFGSDGAPRERRPHILRAGPAVWDRIEKVVVVVLENTDYENAVNQPFLGSLIKQGALLTNYFGITHPSQPNYIAMIAGSTFGVGDNKNVTITAQHVGDLLSQSGKTWKSYTEGYPGNCFLGSQLGAYVRKHQPFLSFKQVQTNADECSRVVNANQYSQDLNGGTLPNYSLYIPDLNNDGHDTGAAFADTWLSSLLTPALNNAAALEHTLFVVTFEEGTGASNNRVLTILFGAGVRPGSVSDQDYDHYCLLRTIEDIFRVGPVGKYDALAPAIDDIWTD